MKRPFFIVALVCLTVVLMGRPAWCRNTDGPFFLGLRPAVQVDGAGIFLQQLVEGDCPGSTNLCLAPAPGLNQAVILTRAQIAQAAAKLDPALILTNWIGAEKIRITRRVRRLDESELKDLLTAALQREQVRDKGELELRFARPWAPQIVPDEPLTIRVLDLPTAGVAPSFIARFELRTEREVLGPWQAPLQARVWRDVWVARSVQPRGRLLRDADFGQERRDLLLLRDALLLADFSNPNIELAESLPAGAPLLLRSVRLRPIIQRGRLLDAVVQDRSILITVKVEALEDGLPGQLIRVRNAKSKYEFRAKVQNEQTVVVPL